MNHFLRGMAQAVCESFPLPGPVLEIGSYQVAGQESIADLRPLFPAVNFLGLDMRAGPGVDVVGSVEKLPFPDQSVGTVVALSTFEHVQRFWLGFEEIFRVLRPDGAVLVACPFYFHIHDYPSDYWRFTPEALRCLLQPYSQTLIASHGPANRPLNVWALAVREQHPGLSEMAVARYRHAMTRYAREPMSPFRWIRYQIATLLSGRRPVAPWLDQNRWRIEYQGSTSDVSKPHAGTHTPCYHRPTPNMTPEILLPDSAPPSQSASLTGIVAHTSGGVCER